VDSGVWKEAKWENAKNKDVGLCNWNEERVFTKKGKGIFVVKGGEKRGMWVYSRTIEERVYQTVVTTTSHKDQWLHSK